MTVRFVPPSLSFLANGALQGHKSMMNLPLHVDEAVFYRIIVAQHVEEDDALKRGLIDSLGREQLTTSINESNLYVFRFSIQILCTVRYSLSESNI